MYASESRPERNRTAWDTGSGLLLHWAGRIKALLNVGLKNKCCYCSFVDGVMWNVRVQLRAAG